MIKSLRKRHFQIWIIWAIIFPVVIVIGWNSIRYPFVQAKITRDQSISFNTIYQSWNRTDYLVEWQFDSSSKKSQLRWLNKIVLTYPTATIYFSSEDSFKTNSSILIGRIEARGEYYFPIDSIAAEVKKSKGKIVLYDFIHQQIIDTLKINP
jgi:hypothetical protein